MTTQINTDLIPDAAITAVKLASGAADGQIGHVVQAVNTQSAVAASGTTTIPLDDTIPQNTEGNAWAAMDTAFTAKSATNKLKFTITVPCAHSVATSNIAIALFQDGGANAIASCVNSTANGAGQQMTQTFSFWMTAGDTSAHTYKLRYGSSVAGTVTVCGNGGARIHGGVLFASMTIEEIKA